MLMQSTPREETTASKASTDYLPEKMKENEKQRTRKGKKESKREKVTEKCRGHSMDAGAGAVLHAVLGTAQG